MLLLCHRPERDSLHPQQMVPHSLVVTGDWGARGAAGSQELTPGWLCSLARHSPHRVLPGHPLPSSSGTAEPGGGRESQRRPSCSTRLQQRKAVCAAAGWAGAGGLLRCV